MTPFQTKFKRMLVVRYCGTSGEAKVRFNQIFLTGKTDKQTPKQALKQAFLFYLFF